MFGKMPNADFIIVAGFVILLLFGMVSLTPTSEESHKDMAGRRRFLAPSIRKERNISDGTSGQFMAPKYYRIPRPTPNPI